MAKVAVLFCSLVLAGAVQKMGPSELASMDAALSLVMSHKNEVLATTDGYPAEPGCYILFPGGCFRYSSEQSRTWRHDVWAEAQGGDESACLARKSVWNKYCGTSDTKMAFIDRSVAAPQKQVDTESKMRVSRNAAAAEGEAADMMDAEKATAERASAEKAAAEQVATEQAAAAEKATAEKAALEKAAAEQAAAEEEEAVAEKVAIDKAVAEGAAMEKQAMEKVAAEKAAAEQAAAEYVATEKAALEEVAAEKAAAETAAAHRASEEQAAAEQAASAQAAAEKEAAEKAAAEKASAEAAAEKAAAETAAVEQAAADRAATEKAAAEQATASAQPPTEPGCYMKMPTGCQNRTSKTEKWRRDPWGDSQSLDEEACRQRKQSWDTYCERSDVQVWFVGNVAAKTAAKDEGEQPKEPGCYMKMPTGCQGHAANTQRWRHDSWAEEHDLDEAACMQRKGTWDKYCEREDVRVSFVPKQPGPELMSALQLGAEWWPFGKKQATTQQAPSTAEQNGVVDGYPSLPGCYMRMPSGCPAKPMKTRRWRHDTWAEEHALDQVACEQRKHVWDKYCGAEDTKMVFVGAGTAKAQEHVSALQQDTEWWPFGKKDKAPETTAAPPTAKKVSTSIPSKPGCYMRMQSGCPAKPMETQMWRHDSWAEKHDLDKLACDARKHVWNRYCGSDDARMVFVNATNSEPAQHVSALQQHGEWWPFGKKDKAAETTVAPPAAKKVNNAVPSKPGCYMRMQSGCPAKPMDTQMWRHDSWAEKHNVDKMECDKRKHVWNTYCGSDDARMVFVNATQSQTKQHVSALQQDGEWWPFGKKNKAAPETAPPPLSGSAPQKKTSSGIPSKPGCYMRMPSGCPAKPMKTEMWRHDTWAEKHDLDKLSCDARKHVWNTYCGSDDARMVFVNATSSEPARGVSALQQDGEWWPFGKKSKALETTLAPPLKDSAPAQEKKVNTGIPSKPGCYMRMPSGCPAKPMKTQMWRHDTWAEKHNLGKMACDSRKHVWNTYCGSDDARMVFVNATSSEPAMGVSQLQEDGELWPFTKKSKAPEITVAPPSDSSPKEARAAAQTNEVVDGVPSKPGCYVRMPTGCPAKPMKTRMWRHDSWAEEHQLAKEACQERKHVWDNYCQTDDSKIMFVGV